ncbi:hypothetical protein HY837_03960 [archaeon]|nr:hypothetical protein [archaeon]
MLLEQVVRRVERPVFQSDPSREFPDYSDIELNDLLETLETERRPRFFKELVLGILQFYFDGLLQVYDTEKRDEQSKVLKSLLESACITVDGFYGEGIPFDQVKEKLLPLNYTLCDVCEPVRAEKRRLSWQEWSVEKYGRITAQLLKNKNIDVIVPIAAGGFEPAVLNAVDLGVNNIFPVRFSYWTRRDSKVLLPVCIESKESVKQQLQGKNVLVVEDIIFFGRSAIRVIDWLKMQNPASITLGYVQEQDIFNELKIKTYMTRNLESENLWTVEMEVPV